MIKKNREDIKQQLSNYIRTGTRYHGIKILNLDIPIKNTITRSAYVYVHLYNVPRRYQGSTIDSIPKGILIVYEYRNMKNKICTVYFTVDLVTH